jgi:hypothetical protein
MTTPNNSSFSTVHPIFQTFDKQTNIKQQNNNIFTQCRSKADTFITHSLWFSPLIETSKSLLAFLPGRFSTTNLSGEALYTILSLIGQYNDQVLGKSTYNPYSIAHLDNSSHGDIQHQSDKGVRYINFGLHFFSIFEALLEQASRYLYITINKSEYESLQNGLNERTSYLTSLLSQQCKFDPITQEISFPPDPQNNGNTIQLNPQLKRFPHNYQSVMNNNHGNNNNNNSPKTLSIEEELTFHPIFQSFLQNVFSNDGIYTYFRSLDHVFITRLYQFKMFSCALIEFIKFGLRMAMLYINNGHLNVPQTIHDITIEQLQYKNKAELKRYQLDIKEMQKYAKKYKSWAKKIRLINSPNVNSGLNTNTNIDKPSAPSLASSYSSSLTTTPFATLNTKQPQQQQQTKKTPQSTPLSPQQQQQQQPPQPTTTSTTNTLTTPHQQLITNYGEKCVDLSIVSNLKLLYLQHHRGVISHGQYASNLIQTYFYYYHSFPKTHGNNDHDETRLAFTQPNPTFVDYILTIYKTPNLLTFGPNTQQTNPSVLLSEANPKTALTATTTSSSSSSKIIEPLSLYTFTPAKARFKHILSEVLYWLRPVVYTLSSALCNQPALSQFVLSTLNSSQIATPQSSQQQPLQIEKTSPSWWSNLIVSRDLSSPSVLPTLLSLVIDFFAFYLSPAYNPIHSMQDLLSSQQQQKAQFIEQFQQQKQQKQHDDLFKPLDLNESINHNNNNNNNNNNNENKTHPITNLIFKQQHQAQLKLLQTQLATWQHRKSNYWLYIFRPPFLTFMLLKPLQWLAKKLENVPLFGGFLHFIIALLKIFQHHYFYACGS